MELMHPVAPALIRTRLAATVYGGRDLQKMKVLSLETSLQQIKVMELEGYSSVNQLVVNSHDSSIVVQVSSTNSTVDDDDHDECC